MASVECSLGFGFMPASLDERKSLLSMYYSLEDCHYMKTGHPYGHTYRTAAIFDALAGPYLRTCAERAYIEYSLMGPSEFRRTGVRSDSATMAEDINDDEQKRTELCLGEDISSEEFLGYFEQLHGRAQYVDDLLRLEDEAQLVEMCERHALYRIRAFQLLRGHTIEELSDDTLKREFPPERLEKEDYFVCFEGDGTFGWFFHPDHCGLAALDDYQRLVPLNEGGCEYLRWDLYRLSYHTHKLDIEYLNYCEEISKKIKWIEDYVCLDLTSAESSKMSNRGAYQAIKIATCFPNITRSLAYLGYQEYVSSVRSYVWRHKELDGIFFEIWKRVAKQKESFRNALKQVSELNKFPLRQRIMEYVLREDDYSEMKEQYHSCTAGIHPEVPEGIARMLIADALRKMCEKPVGPKTFEQYIRKKLKIAEYIGLIPNSQVECKDAGGRNKNMRWRGPAKLFNI